MPKIASVKESDVSAVGGKESTMKPTAAIHKTLTTRTVLLAALILLLVGIGCLALSHSSWFVDWPIAVSVLRDLGSLLTVSACLTTAWDLIAKRAFKDELLATVQLSSDINRSGIVQVPASFNEDIPWRELLTDAKKVDLFFAYARTWRGLNVQYLRELAADTEARIRVLLPDPEVDIVVKALAMNFLDHEEKMEAACTNVRNAILEAEADLKRIFCDHPNAKASFKLRYYSKVPFFSAYRIDNRTIIAFYKHTHGRGGVPAFVATKGGTVNDFVYSELEYLLRDDCVDSRLAVECPRETN